MVGLLVAVAFSYAVTRGGQHPGTVLTGYGASPGPAVASSSTRSAFGIHGGTTGLYPGRSQPLELTVTNPQSFAITVTSITTAVGPASAACPAADLQVGPFGGSLAVPAGGRAAVAVTATLAGAAPDACQGALFPLQYTGQGQKS